LATNKLSNLSLSFVRRTAPRSGPTSSNAWNDSFAELSSDSAKIVYEWNNKLVPVFEGLPDGTVETTINVYKNGLDAKNLWVDQEVTSISADLLFYNLNQARPYTVEEALRNLYTYTDTQIEEAVDAAEINSGALTVGQKTAIGDHIFNSVLTSSATSLDGKSENSRLNLLQLANDIYGPS
jgi:hypothetical protein